MKTVVNIQTESGKILTDPEQGIIVVGSIFKAHIDTCQNPIGGLIGNAKDTEKMLNTGITKHAYTNKEFIKALCIDPFELCRIAEELRKEATNESAFK